MTLLQKMVSSIDSQVEGMAMFAAEPGFDLGDLLLELFLVHSLKNRWSQFVIRDTIVE